MLRHILLGTTVLGFIAVPLTTANAQKYSNVSTSASMPSVSFDRNIQANIDSAQQAINGCNRAALDAALNNLHEQQDELQGQSRQKPNPFFDPAAAAQKASEVGNAMAALKAKWNAQYPCGQAEATNNSAYLQEDVAGYYDLNRKSYFDGAKFSAGVSAGHFGIPDLPGVVGSEVPGMASTRQFERIKPEDSGTGQRLSFGLELPIDLGPVPPNILPPNIFNNLSDQEQAELDLILGVERTTTSFTQAPWTYSANGEDTLLVGVGGGPSPSGYVVGAANGDIDNIMYNRNFEGTRFEAGLGQKVHLQKQDSVITLRPFVGLGYGHSTTEEMFGGRTNSGTLDFSYTTKINSHSFEPFVGFDLSARPQYLSKVFQTDVQLNAGARYGYEFINVDGYDSLTVSGALNQTGMVDLDENEQSHNLKFNTGVVFNPDGAIRFEVGADFERTNNALVIMRDGTGPSYVSNEGQNVVLGTIRATFTF